MKYLIKIAALFLLLSAHLTSCATTNSNAGNFISKKSEQNGTFNRPEFNVQVGDTLTLFIKECNPKRITALKSPISRNRSQGRCWIRVLGEGVVDRVDEQTVTVSTSEKIINEFVWIDKSIPTLR